MKFAITLIAVISMIALSFDDIYLELPDGIDREETAAVSAVSVDIVGPLGNDGNPGRGMVSDVPTDDPLFTAMELNTWQINGGYAYHALGLEFCYLGGTPVIAFASNNDDSLYFANVADMTRFNASDLDASNSSPFGCCVTPPGMTTTDFSTSSIFTGLWDSWSSYSNPAGNDSRGITSTSGDYLWITRTTGTPDNYVQYLGRMQEEVPGSIVWYDAGHGLGGTRYLSGLTDFVLYGGNTCLAYVIYNSQWVRFQEFTGSAIEWLGYADLGLGADAIYGICYCDSRDSFYVSYLIGSNYYVSEFSINVTALNQSTWGEIKSSF